MEEKRAFFEVKLRDDGELKIFSEVFLKFWKKII